MKYCFVAILIATSAIAFTIYMSKRYNAVDRITLNSTGSYITKKGMYVPINLLNPEQSIEVQTMLCADKGGITASNGIDTYCHISWE